MPSKLKCNVQFTTILEIKIPLKIPNYREGPESDSRE